MGAFIAAILLLALAVSGVVVRKTYYYIPAHELKRQAEKNDPLARQLYRAVAYGNSLRVVLWLFIAVTSAAGFVLLSRVAPVWISLLAVVALLWVAYSWLPASKVSSVGARLASAVTSPLTWVLNYLHPLLSRVADIVEKRYSASPHTGIFERDDLLRLIEQQRRQSDSRLSQEELEIAKRALNFDKVQVGDVLTPRSAIKTVLADDTLGPILIDELHKWNQECVLVQKDSKGPFVGVLSVKQLGLQSKGHVRDIMNHTVYYVHENDTLGEALHAFFVTNYPLFVVVNNFEEYVGVISVENILQQLLGHIPGDDFDQYADMVAVAARHSRAKKAKKPSETPEKVVE